MKVSIVTLLICALLTVSCKQTSVKQESTSGAGSVNVAPDKETSAPTDTINPMDVNHLIKDDGAGPFLIGKDIPSDGAEYKLLKETKVVEEGNEEPFYQVWENNKEVLTLSPEYDQHTDNFLHKINTVEIFSDRYKTAEGIGVGSTIEEFVHKYPDFGICYTYISSMYLLDTKQYKHVQFILDSKDYIGTEEAKTTNGSDMAVMKVSDFRKNATIKSVRIW